MKGLELIHNNKSLRIGIGEELLVVNINTVRDEPCTLYVASANQKSGERNIWHTSTRVSLGDVFEVQMADIPAADPPVERGTCDIIDIDALKLEEFYKLESLLKEKGLL